MDYSKIDIKRKELNISQDDLARKAGISKGGLQKIQYNKSTTVPTLEKISAALGVPMTYWFEDEENRCLVFESFTPYEIGSKSVIDQLKKDKENMQMQIDLLLEKLNKCEVEKRKAVG
jgi:transcriptional regulator with XRE-family HTH domain